MKILITGVHGFVGSNLVEALKKEHTIYGLDIINPAKAGVAHTFSWDEIDEAHGAGLMVTFGSWFMIHGSWFTANFGSG